MILRTTLVRNVLRFFPAVASAICLIEVLTTNFLLHSNTHIDLYGALSKFEDALLIPFPNFLFIFVSDFTKHSDWYVWTGILYVFCILPISLMTGFCLDRAVRSSRGVLGVLAYGIMSLASYLAMMHAILAAN
jgi:hypothetical protein